MSKQEEKHQVDTILKNGKIYSCVYPSYERAKQAADCKSHVWKHIEKIEIIKV